MCCVATTVSARPHDRSLSMSTGFGTFSQNSLSVLGTWFRFPCSLVDRHIFLSFSPPFQPSCTKIATAIVLRYKLMPV